MSTKYNILEGYKEQEALIVSEFGQVPFGNNPNKLVGQYIAPYDSVSANPEDKELLHGALARTQDMDFLNAARDYYGDDVVATMQNNWSKVRENKIAPYDISPYPFTIEDDLPVLKKARDELLEERESEKRMLDNISEEDRELYEMGSLGSATPAEINVAVNRPFFLSQIKKTAAYGVNPLSQVKLPNPEQGTEFYSKRALIPRAPTVEQAEFLGKQFGLNGTYKYLDPKVPEDGIMYKAPDSDEWVMWDSPFVDRRDIGEGFITETPAAIGDAILTMFGARGAGKVLEKAKDVPILGALANFKGLEPLFNNKTSPGMIGRLMQKVGLSGFSAAGASIGDFSRLWAGKMIGAHDADMGDMLKEAGVIGMWAMGGTFVISTTADVLMKIMRLTTGDVPPEFLSLLDDAMRQAEASKQGIKISSPESVYGTDPTVKQINQTIDELAERAGDDFLKTTNPKFINKDGTPKPVNYDPTVAQAAQSEIAADLQRLFLEMATDPDTARIFKDMIEGNKELERRFFKALNAKIGAPLSELTEGITGASLKPLIREAAEQRKAEYEAAAREAFENIRLALETGDEDAAMAAGEALLREVETRGGIYKASSSQLDQIKQQHINNAAEEFKTVLSSPRYESLTSGSGYIGKAAREWSQGISEKSASVLKHIETAGLRDDFWQMLGPEGKVLLNKLQGYESRQLIGTKANIKRLENKGVIAKGFEPGEPLFTRNGNVIIEKSGKQGRPNFTLTELNDTRVMLNDYISQSNNIQGTKAAKNLRDAIGSQVDRTVLEGAAGEVGKLNGLSGEALEQFIKTNSRNKGSKAVREYIVETGYGNDIAEAFVKQVDAYKRTKTDIMKQLLNPQANVAPETIIRRILGTNTPGMPNSTMRDFVTILKDAGADELFALQKGMAQHIKDKFRIGVDDTTGAATTAQYKDFIDTNKGTLKAIFGDEFNQTFLLGGEKAFQKQVLNKIDEQQKLIDEVNLKFGTPKNAGIEDIIRNILDVDLQSKKVGDVLDDVDFLMRTLKNNPGVKFQVSVVTKRWLRDKFVKELQGTGEEVRIDGDALNEFIRAFGPQDSSGQRLTFENFIEPLIGEEGKTYVKYLKDFNSLVQRNIGPAVSKYAAGEAARITGEGTASPIKNRELLQRLFFSPLTIASRRVTALSNRINNRSREYIAEMLLKPDMLKRTMDYANGRVKTQNFIRFLASLDSVAANDLGNQLELYDSVYQKTEKEKRELNQIDYQSRLAPDFNPITTAIGTGAGAMNLISNLGQGAIEYGSDAIADFTGADRIAELELENEDLMNQTGIN